MVIAHEHEESSTEDNNYAVLVCFFFLFFPFFFFYYPQFIDGEAEFGESFKGEAKRLIDQLLS